jgi:hypothetical protein
MTDGETTDARRILEQHIDFADGTSLHAVAWKVAESPSYPDGVHYRYHYGSSDGTIVRYDNAHGHHERHNPNGTVERIEFPGATELYNQFLDDVAAWRREVRK